MKQIVKEMFSPSKKYKAVIMKRSDGLNEYCVYNWTKEEVPEYGYVSEWHWSSVTSRLSLTDTESTTIKLALEELQLLSGEKC